MISNTKSYMSYEIIKNQKPILSKQINCVFLKASLGFNLNK